MPKVKSSNIYSVDYDGAKKNLSIVFHNSEVTYVYKNVPASVHTKLMAAQSKGIFFSSNIKNQYPFHKKG